MFCGAVLVDVLERGPADGVGAREALLAVELVGPGEGRLRLGERPLHGLQHEPVAGDVRGRVPKVF